MTSQPDDHVPSSGGSVPHGGSVDASEHLADDLAGRDRAARTEPSPEPNPIDLLPAGETTIPWIFPLPQTVVAVHRRLQSEFTGAGREQRLDPFKVSAMLFELTSIAHIAGPRADAAALAACLMAACLRLRPSPVGNRRLGFALAMLFLRLNGAPVQASPMEKFTFASRFGYPGFESNVFADWIRLRRLAQRSAAGTVVRVRTRDGRIEGVSVLRPASTRQPRRRLPRDSHEP